MVIHHVVVVAISHGFRTGKVRCMMMIGIAEDIRSSICMEVIVWIVVEMFHTGRVVDVAVVVGTSSRTCVSSKSGIGRSMMMSRRMMMMM